MNKTACAFSFNYISPNDILISGELPPLGIWHGLNKCLHNGGLRKGEVIDIVTKMKDNRKPVSGGETLLGVMKNGWMVSLREPKLKKCTRHDWSTVLPVEHNR